MSSNTTTPGSADMTDSDILGLPVDTFAFIIAGVGLAAAVLFIIAFCLVYKHRQNRLRRNPLLNRGSKFDNVREIWEQDTRNRLENLKNAGYSNGAFQNLDEYRLYSVEEYANYDRDKYNKINDGSVVATDNGYVSDDIFRNGDCHKMNGDARRVTFNSVPIVQINGTSVTDIDHEISNHSDIVCQNPVKKPDDLFVGKSAQKKHSNILVSNKTQLQLIQEDTDRSSKPDS